METTFTIIKPIHELLVKLAVKILLLPIKQPTQNKLLRQWFVVLLNFKDKNVVLQAVATFQKVFGKMLKNIWLKMSSSFKMGSPEDMGNFITAVIHEGSFDKLAKYIDPAKKDKNAEIIVGGNYDKSKGYFIEPTVIVTKNPKYTTMCTELFGPVITMYVYDDKKWEETLHLVDETSEYALTGAVFSEDRYALEEAVKILENAAGNFYINDKPTGAVVGQQPFGGARATGTNDKAGSEQNLYDGFHQE